jgi:hypothetical protein
LPVPAEQLPNGTIIVKEIKAPAHVVGLYARSVPLLWAPLGRQQGQKAVQAMEQLEPVSSPKHRPSIVDKGRV